MTAIAATVRSVFDLEEAGGPKGGTVKLMTAKIAFDLAAGTYAQADGVTILRADIATAIQNARRNGKTVTVIGLGAAAAPGAVTVAGVKTPVSYLTPSGTTTLKFLLATGADWVTELGNATAITTSESEPLTVHFAFTESK